MSAVPQHTPGKHPFVLPTDTLREAIEKEWAAGKKFTPTSMPFTALAYTAIDQMEGKREHIVEVLMAYIDTDTLSYRSSTPALIEQQKKEWDPVLAWAGNTFSALWQTTSGIMPLTQPAALHEAVREYLSALDAMRLAVACVFASGFSSLVLAIAVLEGKLTAERAYALSRLEEEAQAIQWGRDDEADARSARLQAEIVETGRFLRLLKTP